MRDHDRDIDRSMDTRNDNTNFMDHSEHHEQEHHEQEHMYHQQQHPPPPPHPIVHHQQQPQPADIFNDIDKTTYIIIFVAFILGFFMGKTMNPVIIRGAI